MKQCSDLFLFFVTCSRCLQEMAERNVVAKMTTNDAPKSNTATETIEASKIRPPPARFRVFEIVNPKS